MARSPKKFTLSLSKVLELIGKPIFYLFTICIVLFSTILHLITYFTQSGIDALVDFFSSLNNLVKKSMGILTHIKIDLPPLPKFFPHISAIILALSLLFYALTLFISSLPSPKFLKETPPALSTKILDRNGKLLYQIYKDENRSLIALSSIPRPVISATLAAEDKNFYHHHGIDPIGIIRALKNNLSCSLLHASCSSSLQGGSTITQQLIKNTLLTSEKTYSRKLKEVILAIWTERIFSKDEILEMYLNQVPYGGVAFGIEEAARQYFNKSVTQVTLAEAAFLAGLPVSPTTLSPFGTTPYLAKIRQQQVLESMVSLGLISENDKINATHAPLNLSSNTSTIQAPHFVMYVRSLLVQAFGESRVSSGGLTVTTSLDLDLQNLLQQEISREISNLNRLNVGNGAGLIIAPQTGEILAMVGSKDFFDTEHDGQVNVTLMPRQPGSSIKPLTYTLAFMRGLSPSSLIDDSPICFRQPGSPDYCPKNYDGNFHGKVTLKTALASSYNVPAIKLLNSLGVNNLVELARSLGITTWHDPSRFGLALTLGGGEVTMLDLAQAYSVFATGGVKVPLTAVLKITDHNHQLLSLNQDPSTKQQVIPETIAFQINQILSDNNARSPAFGYNSVLNLSPYTVAVKTGTTNNLRDNWTIGYTPKYLVATWVGNNDNAPMSQVVSGITGASPIWSRTMKSLLQNEPLTAFIPPNSIVKARISCESSLYDYFIKGQEPKLNCDIPNEGQVL